MIRLIVRGYGGGRLVFQERIEVEKDEDLEPLAKSQIERLCLYDKHMLEVEFLDEPDPLQRFFRFGTDASRMDLPIQIKFTRPN